MDAARWVAHRGYPRSYPENTSIGVEAALRAGARYVEVDVQLSSDRVPFLFHDRDLKRVCGVRGALHEHSAAWLGRLRAAERERFGARYHDIPLATLGELVQLLEAFPGADAFVEIKRAAVERFGMPAVVEATLEPLDSMRHRCAVISFDFAVVPELARHRWPRSGVILSSWSQLRDGPSLPQEVDYIFCKTVRLPRSGSLHIDGAELVVYDVVDPALAEQLVSRGVDLVETFAIAEMLRHSLPADR